jgi:hypothetical protein
MGGGQAGSIGSQGSQTAPQGKPTHAWKHPGHGSQMIPIESGTHNPTESQAMSGGEGSHVGLDGSHSVQSSPHIRPKQGS